MFHICQSQQEINQFVTSSFLDCVQSKPNATLGLATGSTMEPVYAELIKQLKGIDLSKVHTFNLDEYIGLDARHPQSYHYYMHQHLFDHLTLPDKNTHLFDGVAQDSQAECRAYEQFIAKRGGIDIQLLGIGTNGHIGFNEPGTPFNSRCHVVDLTEQTRRDNSRFFDRFEDMPTQAMTMGLENILEAKKVILIITGKHKAEIVKKLYSSPIDPLLPASVLKDHKDVTVVLDPAASSLL